MFPRDSRLFILLFQYDRLLSEGKKLNSRSHDIKGCFLHDKVIEIKIL